MATNALSELRDALREFALQRDWDQFHAPKNLAIALSVEASELLECFQWRSESQSECSSLGSRERLRIEEEMADVLLYLIRLADKLEVDLLAAASKKMARNAEKYPIEKARGNSKKYTEL